jgi:glyceraldehyde-3-phosphate dehydrogenase/erythrose-4-phosphate dehydrogenase
LNYIYFIKEGEMRVAINGLGRIGRLAFKIGLEKGIDIAAVNDLASEDSCVYLMKYDSVFRNYDKSVKSGKGFLNIGGKKIKYFSEKDPENLPWRDLGIDVVLECTGIFKDREGAGKHLKAGAKKVVKKVVARAKKDGKKIEKLILKELKKEAKKAAPYINKAKKKSKKTKRKKCCRKKK